MSKAGSILPCLHVDTLWIGIKTASRDRPAEDLFHSGPLPIYIAKNNIYRHNKIS